MLVEGAELIARGHARVGCGAYAADRVHKPIFHACKDAGHSVRLWGGRADSFTADYFCTNVVLLLTVRDITRIRGLQDETLTKEFKMTIETLIAEFAEAHRALRIAKGYNDYNLDQVVAYACADMLNSVKNCSDPVAMLADEVAFERECLERLAA